MLVTFTFPSTLACVQVAGIITERDYLRKVVVAGKSSKELACSALMTSTHSIVTLTPEDTVAKVRAPPPSPPATRAQVPESNRLRVWHLSC